VRQNNVILLVGWLALWSCTAHAVSADEPGDVKLDEQRRAAVTKFLEAAKKVWNDDYGNVHYEMVQTREYPNRKGEKRRVATEINYWSRDNRYFRLDTKTIESNATSPVVGERRRIVVGPDGFVELSARSAGRPLVITEWGTTEQGIDWLLGNFSVLASVRSHSLRFAIIEIGELVGSELIDEVPSFLVKKGIERKLIGVTLLDGGSRFEVKWTRNDGPVTGELTMLCDVEHGVVLHCEGRYLRDGIVSSIFEESKEYEFEKFRRIPSYYRSHLDESGSSEAVKYWKTIEFRPRLVDWKPVSMGIFSLEAQGVRSVAPGSVWGRRLLTLLVGLVLLGVYVAVKQVRSRGTE